MASMAETSRDVGKSVEALAIMLSEDHKVLFASVRGMQWEVKELRDHYGYPAKTSD